MTLNLHKKKNKHFRSCQTYSIYLRIGGKIKKIKNIRYTISLSNKVYKFIIH